MSILTSLRLRAPQQIGDVPDDITVFFEGFEVFHECLDLGREAEEAGLPMFFN